MLLAGPQHSAADGMYFRTLRNSSRVRHGGRPLLMSFLTVPSSSTRRSATTRPRLTKAASALNVACAYLPMTSFPCQRRHLRHRNRPHAQTASTSCPQRSRNCPTRRRGPPRALASCSPPNQRRSASHPAQTRRRAPFASSHVTFCNAARAA